jgi:hypothetical protein
MKPLIYIQIHMLEATVKQLENQARKDFRYNESFREEGGSQEAGSQEGGGQEGGR